MSEPRRFSDDELQAVLARAVELDLSDERRVAVREVAALSAPGRTLAEIQAIAAEAGIGADAVARAAAELSAPAVREEAVRRFAGVPIGVGADVTFDTPVGDEEWTRFVVELRETFQTRGTLREQGPFREWYNGNLHATLEPVGGGHRLRLRTVRGSARELIAMASVLPFTGAAFAVLGALAGKPKVYPLAAMLALAGAAFYAVQAISVHRWSRTRAWQFRELLEQFARERGAATDDDARASESAAGGSARLPPDGGGTVR